MMYTYIVRGSVHVARLEDKDYSADLFSLQFDEPCNSYVKFQFSHVRFHTHCNGVVIPVSSKKIDMVISPTLVGIQNNKK